MAGVGGIDAGGGGVPDLEAGRDDAVISSEIDRGRVDPCLDAVSAISASFARGDGPIGSAAAAWGSAASRAGGSGIGLGAVDTLTDGGGGVVSILLRDVVKASRSSLPETEAAMDAVSASSGGGGVTEFPRFGKPRTADRDGSGNIFPPARERKVDFFWGLQVGGLAVVVERE